MSVSITNFYQKLRRQHPHFALSLAAGLLLGFWRSWGESSWWLIGWSTLLFGAGVLLAQLVFLGDEALHYATQQHLPLGNPSEVMSDISPLRRGYMLLVLPVLALFLISSTRATLGLGFFWGLSSVYWWDLWRYFTDTTARAQLHQRYFNQFPATSAWVTGILLAYLAYGLILTVVLGWQQGTT